MLMYILEIYLPIGFFIIVRFIASAVQLTALFVGFRVFVHLLGKIICPFQNFCLKIMIFIISFFQLLTAFLSLSMISLSFKFLVLKSIQLIVEYMKYEYVSDDCIAYHGFAGSVYLCPPYYNDWKYSVEVYVFNFDKCSYDFTCTYFSDLPEARLCFDLKVKELKDVL